MPPSAGQGEGRRAEGSSSSTDLTALGSETGGCRACPAAAPPPWGGQGGWAAPTSPRGPSLAPESVVGSSVAEESHTSPVSASRNPQAVQWLHSSRTQPFLCPFLAVAPICLNLEGAVLVLQQPGRGCSSLCPAPAPAAPLWDVGGARGQLCPGQGVKLGPGGLGDSSATRLVPPTPAAGVWGPPGPELCHCREEPPATLCAVPRHIGLPWGGIATLSRGTGAVASPGHCPRVSPFPLLLFPPGLLDPGSELVLRVIRPGWAVPRGWQ